ncbi:hypothetical protein KIW74_gp50 [Mycobacterium phage Kimona]|uniref:Uncharacterized protein n=1 Tax=Mycobacterium phage Kimona TaxID=2024295 RepID=A0A249XU36_9CAUD|nr:hypothetical protein KIW74_gp50 [Mycobacterium phage Kimona]ASZ75478.1 hypothetical protein PBI_KIMONA_42 [Mycobacterium phage Kimona]
MAVPSTPEEHLAFAKKVTRRGRYAQEEELLRGILHALIAIAEQQKER